MASHSSTTTGHDICEHMIRDVEKFVLDPAKICGPTTDGAPSMTGRTNGIAKKFRHVVGGQDVVVSPCIIHQENVCTKVLACCAVCKLHQSTRIKSSAIQSISGIPGL